MFAFRRPIGKEFMQSCRSTTNATLCGLLWSVCYRSRSVLMMVRVTVAEKFWPSCDQHLPAELEACECFASLSQNTPSVRSQLSKQVMLKKLSEDLPTSEQSLQPSITRNCQLLVNTSFNLFGEPLVVKPRDAVR